MTDLASRGALAAAAAQKGLTPELLWLEVPVFPGRVVQVETVDLATPEPQVAAVAAQAKLEQTLTALALEKAAMVFRPQLLALP
jgi:hypothetical protein